MDSFTYSVGGQTGNILDLPSTRVHTTTLSGDELLLESSDNFAAYPYKRIFSLYSLIEVPENTTLQYRYQFRKRVRSRESFPHDASRGTHLPLSLLKTESSYSPGHPMYQTTYFLGHLLIVNPIPDFSMPFNVITLVSTVTAFLLGSIINVLVRKTGKSTSFSG
jgi:hypothetical protein